MPRLPGRLADRAVTHAALGHDEADGELVGHPVGKRAARGPGRHRPHVLRDGGADVLAPGLRLSLACDEQDYSGLGPAKTLSSFDNY